MTRFGYFLACEEYQPHELLEQARLAEDAGFSFLWISDHFHPWNSQQGQSAFVWSMIGALAQECSLPVTTAVTCPTMRIHPAVIAQAAATSAVLMQGGFTLGLGTGEALNEHITGQVWPPEAERLDMLAEAVAVIRRLWSGQVVSHRGCHFRIDTARLFTLPESPPPIFLSAFGPKATELAAHIADGFITTKPDRGWPGSVPPRAPTRPHRRDSRWRTRRPSTKGSARRTGSGRTRVCLERWHRSCPRPSTSSRPASW